MSETRTHFYEPASCEPVRATEAIIDALLKVQPGTSRSLELTRRLRLAHQSGEWVQHEQEFVPKKLLVKNAKAASRGEIKPKARVGRGRAITEEERAMIVRAYVSGRSVRNCATFVGRGEQRVREVLRAAGAIRQRKPPCREQVREMILRGDDDSYIAEACHCTTRWVKQVRRQMGRRR